MLIACSLSLQESCPKHLQVGFKHEPWICYHWWPPSRTFPGRYRWTTLGHRLSSAGVLPESFTSYVLNGKYRSRVADLSGTPFLWESQGTCWWWIGHHLGLLKWRLRTVFQSSDVYILCFYADGCRVWWMTVVEGFVEPGFLLFLARSCFLLYIGVDILIHSSFRSINPWISVLLSFGSDPVNDLQP